MSTKKKPKARWPKALTAWAEVYEDGTFTVYDLAPTKRGIMDAKQSTSRAIKVRIWPVVPR